jgi:hypothetical protein
MNFRMFELLNLIQIKPEGKRQGALFTWAKMAGPNVEIGEPSGAHGRAAVAIGNPVIGGVGCGAVDRG